MAATPQLALDSPGATPDKFTLSAGWDVAAAPAFAGVDVPWLQRLFAGGQSLCRSAGDLYLGSADPARYATAPAPAGPPGDWRMVCGR